MRDKDPGRNNMYIQINIYIQKINSMKIMITVEFNT